MTHYSATLDYLFSKFPMYQNVGKSAYKSDLGPITELLSSLNHPENQFPSIHVGGTNGKGSVSHMLASVLQTHGNSVGLYTSPHLLDFRERIKINGKPISKQFVIDFVDKHKSSFEKVSPSFFEWSVALAFTSFADQKVDIAIVEVGMGGRLDATNVITPLLSIITNIGLDHRQFLGDTHEEIAREKAGIIKQGVPVIIGETREDTLPVFEEVAKTLKSPIHIAEYASPYFTTDLRGAYQRQNLKTTLTALDHLPQFNLNKTTINKGLNTVVQQTALMGRWQQLSSKPLCIADLGHNEEGLTYNMKQLQNEAQGDCYLLLGFVNDKNLSRILDLFPSRWTYIPAEANNRRAIPLKELNSHFTDKGLKTIHISGTIHQQLSELIDILKPTDTLYIGGSTFVVAEALDFFH